MKFLAPLAFAFAATIPVVILFYLLKRKRVMKLTSSTLLWQRFLAETQANAPFQKLRHNWLLVLQILMLLLAVLALARPYYTGNARSTRLRVLVLDASASMQATDEKPTRFEKARAAALKWVEGMGDGEQMMVLLAGARTEVKQSPTSDKLALRRALESCQPTDGPTRLAEALSTAGAFTFEQRGEETVTSGEIHLFSDGAIPDVAEFANKNLPLVYHRIGSGAENIGLSSLDVRANPDNLNQRAIFASIANPTTNDQTVEVELRFDNAAVESRTVQLPPTNTTPLVFVAEQSRDGIFTVALNTKDQLAADNQGSVASLLPRPVNVLLVTRGNRFLEKALRPLPNVHLTTAPVLTDNAPGFDVVVLDNVEPMTWPKGNVLAINITPTNLFSASSRVEAPAIVDWKNTHPLLRFVNFDNVFVNDALAVKPPTWGVPLVESAQTPLIIAGEVNRQRVVWVGFDTLLSTWPLRISFPIFLQNTLDWLNPASGHGGQLTIKAGETFRYPIGEHAKEAQVTLPNGNTREIAVEPNAREIIFGDTVQQGIYRLRAGTNDVRFCVNLMDAAETDIRPRDELPIGKFGAGLAANKTVRANAELWRWLALAGLAVLMFEWWWYHKRTA
jgi:Ca-activated chloride channel homolog